MSIESVRNGRPKSTQELVDSMGQHRESLRRHVSDLLPPNIADAVQTARESTREALSLSPDKLVVIFGEQAYGLNERPKVLGKRLFAKGVEQHDGIQAVELFASCDTISSEPALYRMQLPNTQSSGGCVSINILRGWRKNKYQTTASLRCPTEEELQDLFKKTSGPIVNPEQKH